MRRPKLITTSTSTFCAIMIANGLAVAIICYWAVRPTFLKREAELHTNETRMELIYLRGLIGLGPLVSTVTSLSFLAFARQAHAGPKSTSTALHSQPREP